MAISKANKQKWNDIVEKLRQRLNLSDEEVVTIKEWGIALLVTGVSVWILYRIVRKLFSSSKKTVEIKIERPEKDEAPNNNKNYKPKDDNSPYTDSSYSLPPWFPLIRKYAGPLLIALAKRQVTRYLRANHIIR